MDDVALGKAVIAKGLLSQERIRRVWANLGPGETLAQALLNRRLVSAEALRELTGVPADPRTHWEGAKAPGRPIPDSDSQATRIDRASPSSGSDVGVPARPSDLSSGEGAALPPRRRGTLPEIGELVDGRYRVEAELGRGGMGAVYKAHDPQRGGPVALKVILPDMAGADSLARFAREARLAAQVDKRGGIVRVYEVGSWDGTPYCAMELVEGQDLSRLFKQQERLEPRRLARLLESVSRSVAVCHDAGIVHRDLKPANILVGADDETKIADFGLARDDESARDRLTKTGDLLGTPAFMAPEQADDARSVDGRADMYALGSILYVGLAGKPAFEGPPHVVINRLLFRDPVRPGKLRAGVPRDLEAVCLKAMAKEPEHRYATAAGLADDLGRFAAGEAVVARPVDGVTRFRRRYARGEPRAVAAVRALQASVLLGVVGCVALVTLVWAPGQVDEHAAWARATLDPVELTVRGQTFGVSEDELRERREALRGVGRFLINEQKALRARRLGARFGAHERLARHLRGEQVKVSTRIDPERSPEDVVIDALIDTGRGREARALERLESLLRPPEAAGGGEGAAPSELQPARLLRLQLLAADGDPVTALGAAAALLEGADDELREYVLGIAKRAVERGYLEALRAAPTTDRVTTSAALRSVVLGAKDLGLRLDWLAPKKHAVLEETAPAWRELVKDAAAELKQRGRARADSLVAHLGLCVRGVEPSVSPGPEINGVTEALIGAAVVAYKAEAEVRVTSRERWDQRMALAAVDLAQSVFYLVDPRIREPSPGFNQLLGDWYIKWPDQLTAEYLFSVLRTDMVAHSLVPSSRKLIDQIDGSDDKKAIRKRFAQLAPLMPRSRALAFASMLIRVEGDEHKDAAHDTKEESRAAREDMIARLRELLDPERWTPDLAEFYVGDVHLWLAKVLSVAAISSDTDDERRAFAEEAAAQARSARELVIRFHRAEAVEQEAFALRTLGDPKRVRDLWTGIVGELRKELAESGNRLGLAVHELAGALRELGKIHLVLGDRDLALQLAGEAFHTSGRTDGEGLRERCLAFYLELALEAERLEDANAAVDALRASELRSAKLTEQRVRIKLLIGDKETARREAEAGLGRFTDAPTRRTLKQYLEQAKE